jgi:hypothetical protein
MSPENSTTPVRKTPAKLAALTAVVLLAHVGLLYGTPVSLVTPQQELVAAFSTRMIAPPAAVPMAAMAPTVVPRPPLPQPAPRPRAQVIQPQFEAPAVQSDGVEETSGESTVAGPAPANSVPESAYGLMSQLLAANGPPSNLKPIAAPVLLAAADEPANPPPTPAPSPARAASGKSAQVFAYPPSMHLKYKINGEVKGFPYYVNGDLQWKQDGRTYDARMEVSHFLLGSRVQTSRGELGATGLEPIRFGDKVRSERAAHFERSKGKVSFSANSPDAPLLPGTQDQLSTLLQLGAMLGGAPASFPEGTLVPFDSVGPTSVESWVFKVGSQERLTLPGGQVSAIKLVREAVGDYGTRGEVWLAPSMGYLPVRIRLIENNGNFVDQKWAETIAP